MLDALEALAVVDIAQRGTAPHGLAVGLTLLDAVERLRRETGFVAAPAADLERHHRVIARRVYTGVRDAIDALPALPWAQALVAEVIADVDRRVPTRHGGGAAARRARDLQRTVAAQVATAGDGEFLPRVARGLWDTEVQAIVALRRAVAQGGDPRAELDQLAAITRTRRALRLDRAQLVAMLAGGA